MLPLSILKTAPQTTSEFINACNRCIARRGIVMSNDRDNLPKSNAVVKDRRAAAKNGPSRRALLKAGGALLGGAAGAGAITGFPTI